MSDPRHHPDDDVLAVYAVGALDSGFALVIAAHLDVCARCRRQVRTFEAASGEALADLPKAELASDALARALARLDEAAPVKAPVDKRPFVDRLTLKTKRWIAPGVWVAGVDTPHAPENRVYLLNVAPGRPTARHEHTGAEFCTVLKGAYRDELGVFAAGDFAAAYGDFNHQPMVEGDEDCLCLFATEGRLKATDMIGRIAFRYANV